jgi:membrane protein
MLTAFAKRLYRTLTRVIPQCGMVAQAVAFNMFLAFFAVLLTALSFIKSSLEDANGQEVAMRISAILPPGSWQLISAYVLRQEVNTWYLAVIGWGGTLLVGSQVIKLIIKGIEQIYGDQETHSFLGRQVRGMLLFCLASVAWLFAMALSVFGEPLEEWITYEFWNFWLVRRFLIVTLTVVAMTLAMLVLALIYRVARQAPTSWRSVLPGAVVATILWWGVNLLFGVYVRKTQYGPVYSGLAAAIGLMAWMEISATLVFVGAAWNFEGETRKSLSLATKSGAQQRPT